jgi:serine/threonine-protein kinase
MRATAELSPETLVGDRYWVQRTLGYGSCGCTYLVYEENNPAQPYVLKEFAPSDNRATVIKKCYSLFEQEAEVLCKLKHDRIPQCFGFFEDNERLFLVQEYIDGKTYCELLQERLALGQVFSPSEVMQWLKDLLTVLDYIHSCRLVHRDISPDNIMLPNGEDRPVLIDFGVVKQVITQIGSQIGGGTVDSIRGTMVGKAGYSPPEQLRLGQCYPNSDIYSLAVTALVLLTGRHPSELCDGYSLKWQWRKYIKLNESLGQIFDIMLAEIPKDRYQSASEVLNVLSTVSWTESSLVLAVPHESAIADSVRSVRKETVFWSEEDTLIAHFSAPRNLSSSTTKIQEQKTKIQIERRKTLKPIGKKRSLASAMRWLATSLLVSGSLIGGWTIGKESPNLTFVCEIFNNCIDGQSSPRIAKGESAQPERSLENTSARDRTEWKVLADPTTEPFTTSPKTFNDSEEAKPRSQPENTDYQQELTEKVQSLQAQLSQLIAQGDRPPVETAPKTERATESDTETPPQQEANPVAQDTNSSPAQTEAKESDRSNPSSSESTNPPESTPASPTAPVDSDASEPQSPPATETSTPIPETNDPPAQTYQPGYWQPVGRIEPQRPFQIKLVNQSGEIVEYAVTTNEFSPRQLSPQESTTLTHIPLDANLLLNSVRSNSRKEFVSSLQFEVNVVNNLITVRILAGDRDRAGDSTVNIHRTGAIYIF